MANFAFTEERLRKIFLENFSEENQKLICEVPVFCRSIDVVKYNISSQEVSAIEFKLSDWKRAIKQVLRVGLCFDYLEICIPKPKTEKAKCSIINSCGEIGLGLYLYDSGSNSFIHELHPKRVETIWAIQKACVINYVEEALI